MLQLLTWKLCCSRWIANHQGASCSLPATRPTSLTARWLALYWVPLEQETERLVADPAPGITASPHDDNLRYFDVTIQGPDGSLFQSASSAYLQPTPAPMFAYLLTSKPNLRFTLL